MKEVSFAQLPFPIVDSYRTMKKRDKNVLLYQKYPAKLNVYKELFHMVVEFELEELKKEDLEEIEALLMKEYGFPFAVLEGNSMLWKTDDFYIVRGLAEKGFQVEINAIQILFHRPFGKKLDYQTYLKVREVFQRMKTDLQLSERIEVVYAGHELMTWLQSENKSYFFEIKKKTFSAYVLKIKVEKDGKHLLPYRKKNGDYKTLEDLYSQIHDFLLQVEKEDAASE